LQQAQQNPSSSPNRFLLQCDEICTLPDRKQILSIGQANEGLRYFGLS